MDPFAHQRTVQQTHDTLRLTQQANEEQRRFHARVTMAGGGGAASTGRGARMVAAFVLVFMVAVLGLVAYVALSIMGTL